MASIRKRVLPSGETRWLVDYRDGSGERRAKMFKRKSDATGWLDRARGELMAGTHVADSASITVSEAADLWLRRAETNSLESSTVRQYRQHAELHIKPRIGGTKLTTLTAPAVQQFADDMMATASRAMVGKVLSSLSGILAEAQARGLVGRNVARDVRVRLPKRHKPRPEMPTADELRAIVQHVAGRWRPLILTAIFTGLRSSELRGLRWEHVDLKGGLITVAGRVDQWGAYGSPKSEAGRRDIPLAPIVTNTLREWRLTCPKSPDGALEWVFPNGAGKPESHANIVNRGFDPLQVAAGVTVAGKVRNEKGEMVDGMVGKYNFHALRHAAAALWIQQGIGPKKLQTLMGHSSIQLVYDTYGYLLDRAEDDVAAMAQVQARLLG